MGSINWGQFWQNTGEAALSAVCSVVYGTGKTMAKAASGDGLGSLEAGLETICPIGIGQTGSAITEFVSGDVAGGIGKTIEAFFPGSFLDPLTNFGTKAVSDLTTQGVQNAIDDANAAKVVANNPALNPKEEDPKAEEEQKVEEKEEARDITNQQATTARKAAYQAAINSGATPAQAQAAADAQTPIGNTAGNYAALAGAGANARADYRERQGYADALGRETKNLEEARKRAIAAAAISGAGAGASEGISLFGNSGN